MTNNRELDLVFRRVVGGQVSNRGYQASYLEGTTHVSLEELERMIDVVNEYGFVFDIPRRDLTVMTWLQAQQGLETLYAEAPVAA